MKDVQSTSLFCFGIVGSFVSSFAFSGFLISRDDTIRDFFWQGTLAISLSMLLFAAIPVFGGNGVSFGIAGSRSSHLIDLWIRTSLRWRKRITTKRVSWQAFCVDQIHVWFPGKGVSHIARAWRLR